MAIPAGRCFAASASGRYQLIVVDHATGASSERCTHELAVEECQSNQAPDCAHAAPSVARLWAQGHDFARVQVLAVTDPDGDAVGIRITGVTNDEPAKRDKNGPRRPSARVVQGGVELLADRDGSGNGRFYEIRFVAFDGQGGRRRSRWASTTSPDAAWRRSRSLREARDRTG